jgi:hypothetical protein
MANDFVPFGAFAHQREGEMFFPPTTFDVACFAGMYPPFGTFLDDRVNFPSAAETDAAARSSEASAWSMVFICDTS